MIPLDGSGNPIPTLQEFLEEYSKSPKIQELVRAFGTSVYHMLYGKGRE